MHSSCLKNALYPQILTKVVIFHVLPQIPSADSVAQISSLLAKMDCHFCLNDRFRLGSLDFKLILARIQTKAPLSKMIRKRSSHRILTKVWRTDKELFLILHSQVKPKVKNKRMKILNKATTILKDPFLCKRNRNPI
jgi:hypothetical protein